MAELRQIFMHVACGRGSVLRWRRCNIYLLPVLWMTSCFHIMALWRFTCIPKRRQNTTNMTGDIPTKFCSTTKTGSTHCELHIGDEICCLRLSCLLTFMRPLYGRGHEAMLQSVRPSVCLSMEQITKGSYW